MTEITNGGKIGILHSLGYHISGEMEGRITSDGVTYTLKIIKQCKNINDINHVIDVIIEGEKHKNDTRNK